MAASRDLTLGPAEYGLIGLQSMLWGSTFFFIALVGPAVAPLTMSALRLMPAVLVLLCVVAWFGHRLPASRLEWMHLTVLSVLNNVLPFVLVVMAQRDVTGGIAAVFNATAPLFTLFLSAYLIAEERLTWSRVAGIVIGIAGVAVLIGADPAGARGIAAPVMLLAAAACYGVANVFARLKLGGYPPFVVATGQMISSLVLSTVIALVVERPWEQPMPAGETLAAIAAMGTFGSAFASLCHFTVLKRAGATNGMLVTIVLPLTPILLGAIFFGERLSLREIAGAAIIAFALVVIDGRLFRRPGFKGRPRS